MWLKLSVLEVRCLVLIISAICLMWAILMYLIELCRSSSQQQTTRRNKIAKSPQDFWDLKCSKSKSKNSRSKSKSKKAHHLKSKRSREEHKLAEIITTQQQKVNPEEEEDESGVEQTSCQDRLCIKLSVLWNHLSQNEGYSGTVKLHFISMVTLLVSLASILTFLLSLNLWIHVEASLFFPISMLLRSLFKLFVAWFYITRYRISHSELKSSTSTHVFIVLKVIAVIGFLTGAASSLSVKPFATIVGSRIGLISAIVCTVTDVLVHSCVLHLFTLPLREHAHNLISHQQKRKLKQTGIPNKSEDKSRLFSTKFSQLFGKTSGQSSIEDQAENARIRRILGVIRRTYFGSCVSIFSSLAGNALFIIMFYIYPIEKVDFKLVGLFSLFVLVYSVEAVLCSLGPLFANSRFWKILGFGCCCRCCCCRTNKPQNKQHVVVEMKVMDKQNQTNDTLQSPDTTGI